MSNTCCTESIKMPHWADGILATSGGPVYRVSTRWTRRDRVGQVRSRISTFRMAYTVEPGIYAVGNPSRESEIFVSANYKLSFDILRRELKGLNAWILVIDTKGINVWCAAGKGTFGTEELVSRMAKTGIAGLVDHRRIIVPQLGAPGVDANLVKKESGFRVYYGPARASDIPAYLSSNYTATREMRTVQFRLIDRLILTPIELNPLLKIIPVFAMAVLLVFGLQPSGIVFMSAFTHGLPIFILGVIAILAGTLFTPVFLPFIPFRSFAIKGWLAGAILIFPYLYYIDWLVPGKILMTAFSFLFFPMVSSYLGLQFTGASTYTSLSGVKKELKIGIPVYISSGIASLVLLVIYKINEWGIV